MPGNLAVNQGIGFEKSRGNINYLGCEGGDINISDRVKKVYSQLNMTIELSRKFPSLLIELWFTVFYDILPFTFHYPLLYETFSGGGGGRRKIGKNRAFPPAALPLPPRSRNLIKAVGGIFGD